MKLVDGENETNEHCAGLFKECLILTGQCSLASWGTSSFVGAILIKHRGKEIWEWKSQEKKRSITFYLSSASEFGNIYDSSHWMEFLLDWSWWVLLPVNMVQFNGNPFDRKPNASSFQTWRATVGRGTLAVRMKWLVRRLKSPTSLFPSWLLWKLEGGGIAFWTLSLLFRPPR
jgi:hypothetical protein